MRTMDTGTHEELAAPFRASPFSVAATIKAQSSARDQTLPDIGKMLSDVLLQLQEVKAVQADMRRMQAQQVVRSAGAGTECRTSIEEVLQRPVKDAVIEQHGLQKVNLIGLEQPNFVHELDMLVCERLRSQTSAICELMRPLIADEVQNALEGTEKRLMQALQNLGGVRSIHTLTATSRRRLPLHSLSETPREIAKSEERAEAPKELEKVDIAPQQVTNVSPSQQSRLEFLDYLSTWEDTKIAQIRAHWHIWWLSRIVFGYWFKVLLAVCTFLNMVYIGSLQTADLSAALDDHNVRVDWGVKGLPSVAVLPNDRFISRDTSHSDFRTVHTGEVLFACFFMFMYFLSFAASPYWFLCGKSRLYYIFDASICVIFHLDVLICAILGHPGSHVLPNMTYLLVFHWICDASDGTGTIQVLGFLRIIVKGAIHSLAVVLVVISVLILLGYCFGVVTLHGIIIYLEGATTGSIPAESLEIIAETYGSMGLTLLSFTMAISGGVDWREILKPLRPLAATYTCWTMLFICLSVYGILNVVTATFVDFAVTVTQGNKQEQIRKKLADQQHWESEIINMFEAADEDGSGTLSWTEFKEYMTHPVIITYFNLLELDLSEAHGLFTLLDLKNTGSVSAKDFVSGCSQLKGVAKSLDLATVRFEFLRFTRRYQDDIEKLTKAVTDQRLALQEIIGGDSEGESLDQAGSKRGDEQQANL